MGFDLATEVETILEDTKDMLVTVGKKVMNLDAAPPLVQIRWFKQRLQELEAKHTPAPKVKTTA